MSTIIRKKSTEEFSCVPYITALVNCLLYTWYGLPVVSCGWENFPVVTINGLGILLEFSFILIYFWFASPTRKASLIFQCMELSIWSHALYDCHLHGCMKSLIKYVCMYGCIMVKLSERIIHSLHADEGDCDCDTCYHHVLHHREHLCLCFP